MITRPPIKYFTLLIPTLGAILFAVLFVIATFYYPGGSQADPNAAGFSWSDNYWCNLLNDKAINGELNNAQPIALSALVILCLALTYFWWKFPLFTGLDKVFKLTIQVCGTLAMIVGLFLFSNFNHDLITNVASLFGLIAMAGTLTGLYKNGWTTLFTWGLVNILLVIANNFLYYNKELISYLPWVQKLTFAAFLLWVCCIDISIYKLIKNGR